MECEVIKKYQGRKGRRDGEGEKEMIKKCKKERRGSRRERDMEWRRDEATEREGERASES